MSTILLIAGECARQMPLNCREIVSIASTDYPLPASRPAKLRLDCTQLAQYYYGPRMPPRNIDMDLCLAKPAAGSSLSPRSVPALGVRLGARHMADVSPATLMK